MKYLSLYTPAPRSAPPSPEYIAEMGKLIEESLKAGTLLATGGLMPLAEGGVRVIRSADRITVTDGPYIETRELAGGFAILQAKSKEEVIELTRKFLDTAGDGQCVLHPIMDDPGECSQD